MICNCGGQSEHEHKVVRNGVVVGRYQKCPSCGRILWTKKPPPKIMAELRGGERP